MSTNCRPAAVAGAFYPESPGELTRTISALLRKVPDWIEPLPKAVIAPTPVTFIPDRSPPALSRRWRA